MRLNFECEYVGVKSKKGFKGNWDSHYTVRNISDIEDVGVVIDSCTFINLKGFKGKRYKIGDKLRFKATVVEDKGVYTIKYIRDIVKIED